MRLYGLTKNTGANMHVHHVRRTLSFPVVPRKPAPKYMDSAGGTTHDLEVGNN